VGQLSSARPHTFKLKSRCWFESAGAPKLREESQLSSRPYPNALSYAKAASCGTQCAERPLLQPPSRRSFLQWFSPNSAPDEGDSCNDLRLLLLEEPPALVPPAPEGWCGARTGPDRAHLPAHPRETRDAQIALVVRLAEQIELRIAYFRASDVPPPARQGKIRAPSVATLVLSSPVRHGPSAAGTLVECDHCHVFTSNSKR